jgi:hypothetical protein
VTNLQVTINYFDTFGDLSSGAHDAKDLCGRIMDAYPYRVNPFMAWSSASASFASRNWSGRRAPRTLNERV